MKILVANWLDRENPQAGGAEEHLHQIFGRLVARGHDVTLLCSGWKGCRQRTVLDGIQVHRSGARYTFSLTGPRYFKRHLARNDFDVVVEDLNKVPLFTPYWTDAPVVPLVHHLFGTTAFQEASFPLAAATWLLERTIPQVFKGMPSIAVSESTKADLIGTQNRHRSDHQRDRSGEVLSGSARPEGGGSHVAVFGPSEEVQGHRPVVARSRSP